MERRLIFYGSNTKRFWETTKQYDWLDPLQAAAGLVHVGTGAVDAVIRDVGRTVDGNKRELQPFDGVIPRTRANIAEILGDAVRLKPFSVLTKLFGSVGDVFADGADAIAGRGKTTRQAITHTLAA